MSFLSGTLCRESGTECVCVCVCVCAVRVVAWALNPKP